MNNTTNTKNDMKIVNTLANLSGESVVKLCEIVYGVEVSSTRWRIAAAYALLHTSRIVLTKNFSFGIFHEGSMSEIFSIIKTFDDMPLAIHDGEIEVEVLDKELAHLLNIDDTGVIRVNIARLFDSNETCQWRNRRVGNPIEIHLAHMLDEYESRIRYM